MGNQHVQIQAPADIEGHLGGDGRYYLLDFARTYPPEAPSKRFYHKFDCALNNVFRAIHKTVLYFRLRPEFVRNYNIPLSSDAFSGFGKDDSDVHDLEVKLVRSLSLF